MKSLWLCCLALIMAAPVIMEPPQADAGLFGVRRRVERRQNRRSMRRSKRMSGCSGPAAGCSGQQDPPPPIPSLNPDEPGILNDPAAAPAPVGNAPAQGPAAPDLSYTPVVYRGGQAVIQRPTVGRRVYVCPT